jgi:2-iminobutanoate/2-iminopropanoate deaminase
MFQFYSKPVMDKKVINTTKAPAPIGPYSQAIISNNMLYMSGQVCINPETNELITGDVAAETHQCMRNLEAILKEAGINFNHVVKTTIFLSDMSLFAQVNEVYGSYFSADYPARETVAVKGLPKGVNVEISMLAAM